MSWLPNDWVKAPTASFQPSKDGRADVLARRGPGGHSVLGAEYGGEFDGAGQRDPAHQLGVQEVPRCAANLPDALILVPPPGGGGIRRCHEEPLSLRFQHAELLH